MTEKIHPIKIKSEVIGNYMHYHVFLYNSIMFSAPDLQDAINFIAMFVQNKEDNFIVDRHIYHIQNAHEEEESEGEEQKSDGEYDYDDEGPDGESFIEFDGIEYD